MNEFVDCNFEGGTFVLDGGNYLRTRFYRCQLVLSRGNFILEGCTIDSCEFVFQGEAETIRDLVVELLGQKPPLGID